MTSEPRGEQLRDIMRDAAQRKSRSQLNEEITALRQQLAEARERNLIANNRADNAEADAAKARATAIEDAWEAVGAALSTETQAVQRRARKAIRSLAGKSTSPDETDTKPHTSKKT